MTDIIMQMARKRAESRLRQTVTDELGRYVLEPFRDVDTGQRLKGHPKQMEIFTAAEERNPNGTVRWPIIIAYGGRGGGKTSAFQHLIKDDLLNFDSNRGIVCMQRTRHILEFYYNLEMEFYHLRMIDDFIWNPKRSNNIPTHLEVGLPNHPPSTLYFVPMDTTSKLDEFKNMQIGFYFIDQAESVPRDTIGFLISSCRKKNSFRRGFITANPKDDKYVDISHRFRNNRKAKIIEIQGEDNPGLPADYIDNLKDLPPHLRRLFYEGKADNIKPYCLWKWDENEDKVEVDKCPWADEEFEKYVLIDPGYGGTTWALELWVKRVDTKDGDFRMAYHVEDEMIWYGKGAPIIAMEALEKWGNRNIDFWMCDPMAFSEYNGVVVAQELRDCGLETLEGWAFGQRTKGDAVHYWNDRLIPDGLFTIKGQLRASIDQMRIVKWADFEAARTQRRTPLKVRKKYDHAFDCVQGLIRTRDTEFSSYAKTAYKFQEEEKLTEIERIKRKFINPETVEEGSGALDYMSSAM